MMKSSHIVKAAAALLLAGALAGCFDVKMEIAITGLDTAVAKTETTISKEIVDVAKLESGETDFCDEGGEVSQTEDMVTCVETVKGSFAEIEALGEPDEPHPTITSAGIGKVKVSFPLADWRKDMAPDEDAAQAMAMMKQMFVGHAMTLRVVGASVVETNMDKTEPGVAEMQIPLTDLFSAEAEVPDEAYAIVKIP